MAFEVRTLYPNEKMESIVTAVLVLLALKALEFIVKALISSSGRHRLSTRKYAMEVATEQAFNPLNYIAWFRGSPDLHFEGFPEQSTRRIPVSRAAIAISIALASLLAEAAFFYAAMPTTRKLYLSQLRLQVNQTNIPQGKSHRFKPNSCAPIHLIGQERARLDAVFAFCNAQTGNDPINFQKATFKTKIYLKQYSIVAAINGSDGTNMISETRFSLLLPNDGENLVVRLHNYIQQNPSTELYDYYEKKKGCTLDRDQKVDELDLSNCKRQVRMSEVLAIMLNYVAVVHNGTAGDIGTPNGELMSVSPGNMEIGHISQQRITAGAVLGISLGLLLLSVICHCFCHNDKTAIIAAMLRQKTKQNIFMPAVSMRDEIIKIEGGFSEDIRSWEVDIFHSQKSF